MLGDVVHPPDLARTAGHRPAHRLGERRLSGCIGGRGAETRITRVLEDALAGIEGVDIVQSSSRNGSADVSMEFKLSRDIEAATNDAATRSVGYRTACRKRPTHRKCPRSRAIPMPSSGSTCAPDNMDALELSDYANRYVSDRLSAIEGVARHRR